MIATDLTLLPYSQPSICSLPPAQSQNLSPLSSEVHPDSPCVNNVTSAQGVARARFCMDYDCNEGEERRDYGRAVIIGCHWIALL